MTPMPPSINYHVNDACNMRCRFCFSQSLAPGDRKTAFEIVYRLAEAGFRKLTFAGGEPTLLPFLLALVQLAHSLGLTTMIVSNGARLSKEYLASFRGQLDWVGLSIDSQDPGTHLRLGRAVHGRHALRPDQYVAVADAVRALGMGLKVNTVVTAWNHREDMSAFIRRLRPTRWKVLQALPVADQNGDEIADVAVSATAFQAFVDRHEGVADDGIALVAESNADMRGTYATLDPTGRFIDNSDGSHRYSASILAVGVEAAWQEIHFDADGFRRRGGDYEF